MGKNKIINDIFEKKIKNKEMHNLHQYIKIKEEIKRLDLSNETEDRLKEISRELKNKAKVGASLDALLVEAYSLVGEAAKRILRINPHDGQFMAAAALHMGNIVEMATGEGKTLTAVMPAYLNALKGEGVHILTFNDYLAERDAKWMLPIYQLLGVSCGFVKEGMSFQERKAAYLMDITYVTGREAAFDYLRDFLSTDVEDVVHRPFNYAIIDEADSILIDEARIPLVIAGKGEDEAYNYKNIIELIGGLQAGVHYEVDQYAHNVSLTDEGLQRVERILGCGNLYDFHNISTLTKINCGLHAVVLLKKNIHYIVRKDRIEIIDDFTGRIADKRHWPDNLHEAVEAKEGIATKSRGKIMGSIAMQYFIKLYNKLAGMTGTAARAKVEFEEMYGLGVVVIPTNKPCIRIDHPHAIYTDKESKEKVIIEEVIRIHSKGQPILIGTSSIEESERLSQLLKLEGIKHNILNAKNDYEEAKVIAEAGDFAAVTVSTNMAGRGVDIKLGGRLEKNKEKVAKLGGLYILASSLHESSRIDDQLRGRGGRQGDPGESKFFISLEDDLIRRYEIEKLIPKETYPHQQQEALTDYKLIKRLEAGQRIIEGYNSDIRRQLWKYSYLIEKQRRIIHERREEVLYEKKPLTLLSDKAKELYEEYVGSVGEEVLRKVEKEITLFHINKCWADYLDYVSYVKEGIHLTVIGGEDPLHQFHLAVIDAFNEMLEDIERNIVETFLKVQVTKNGIDLVKEGLLGPSSTCTYLISDNPTQFSNLPFLVSSTQRYIKGTLFSLTSIYKNLSTKVRKFIREYH